MAGELTVGAVPLALMLLIPETVRTFGSAFPQIQLRIMEELYIAQLTRLRKGEFDIALGPLPEDLAPGEFVVESLMPIAMVIVVRKGNPLAKARRLADLAKAPWVYTGTTADSGYARILYERNGLRPPPAGAHVNSTLGLLSILANGECVGLLPRQIAVHPLALQYLDRVTVAEGPLNLVLGALARKEVALKPSVKHFLAHLHRAAHHLAEPRPAA
jgi:DNA-binding transcriptional LysR family regulator